MLTQFEIINKIFNYIKINQGCTAIELVTKSGIIGEEHSLDLPAILEELIINQQIVEVESPIVINNQTKTISTYYLIK